MSKKRKAADTASDGASKRPKARKQWQTNKPQPAEQHAVNAKRVAASVEPGDAGIWVTCDMGKKGRCSRELLDLFDEYAIRRYPEVGESAAIPIDNDCSTTEQQDDIEATIQNELRDLAAVPAAQSTESSPLFTLVKGDTECLMFFKTRSPVEPVTFVHALCSDAAAATSRMRSRFVRRLTPMTLMGRASEKGLEEVARQVLAPAFHQPNQPAKKFAIRPTFRNHSILSRDAVIKQVANLVGPEHSVDLQDYDALILVDLYKNVCGMSVVGPDYDRLKRYNLSELFEPTPKTEQVKEATGST